MDLLHFEFYNKQKRKGSDISMKFHGIKWVQIYFCSKEKTTY